MTDAGYTAHYVCFVQELLEQLRGKGVHGVEGFHRKLYERADDKEGFEDVLTEGRFGLVLVKNEFRVHLEPAPSGPDLLATWRNHTMWFEVTTLRPNWDDTAVGEGKAMWVGLDPPEHILSKICQKLYQLREDDINVIVLWSRSVRCDDLVALEAFKCLEGAIEREPEDFCRLGGVLFTSGIDLSTGTQFLLYKNARAVCPVEPLLEHTLRGLSDHELAAWWKEFALAVAGRLHTRASIDRDSAT